MGVEAEDGAAMRLAGVRDFFVGAHAEFCASGSAGTCIDLVGSHRGLVWRSLLGDTRAAKVRVRAGSSNIEIHGCELVGNDGLGVQLGAPAESPSTGRHCPPTDRTPPPEPCA